MHVITTVSGLNDRRKLEEPSFITLKVPIFYYIDQHYLISFFCVQSHLVIASALGKTYQQILR